MKKTTHFRWALAQYLELHWWKRYLRRQAPEAYLERKRRYWKRVLEQVGLELPVGQRVLDAGCGPAGIYMVLKEQQVDAVDPLLEHYAAQLPHFHPEDYPWTAFHPVAFEDWKPEKYYDWVFCLNAINHFRDLEQSLAQLAGAVLPGGHLLLAVDAHKYAPLKRLFQWIPGDVLHPHQLSATDYRRLMEAHGIQVRQMQVLRKGRIFDYVAILGASPANRRSGGMA